MAEPTTNAATGIAVATGAITLTGSIFGLQYDALLFGFFGGLMSLMHLPAMSVVRTAATLASASLTGALGATLGAPILIGMLLAQFPWLKSMPTDPVRLGAALGIGVFLQAMVQLALAWLAGRTKQAGGGA